MHIGKKILGVGMATLALTALQSATASATTVQPSCHTTGANGTITVRDFHNGVKSINVSLQVDDILPDGKNAGIRLLTTNISTVKKWSWHINTKGNGTWQKWKTHATDSSGIGKIGVEVGRFEGNYIRNSCVSWI
ncbi:hypothetical protein ACWGLP_33390 [Streptomyces lydicus]|uniref:hypothetical protein n=1 Tax=Streptomyces lydicus TaxID=47763 RepID=UPI0037025DCB